MFRASLLARRGISRAPLRTLKTKPEGDISSVFSSLSNEELKPLPKRFVALKRSIVGGNAMSLSALHESWKELLGVLSSEIAEIKAKGNEVGASSLLTRKPVAYECVWRVGHTDH